MDKITLFWFRRDLRLEDNLGLYYAYENEARVLPLFIFDTQILDDLSNKKDARVSFIHAQIKRLHDELKSHGSSLLVKHGKPKEVFEELIKEYEILNVYTNRDYEPYARERDKAISNLLKTAGIEFLDFKDQVIYEKDEITTDGGSFYKVFTPYSKRWLKKFKATKFELVGLDGRKKKFFPTKPLPLPELKDLGFEDTDVEIPVLDIDKALIKNYDKTRNFPGIEGTSRLGIHLRFGTVSIRKLALVASDLNDTYLNELIWREFYMMVLYHQPEVVDRAFKPQYDNIKWRNNREEFKKWCEGKTGFPLVDAGMRQLNKTGYMHNRVRMVTASFLVKHLLQPWQQGEAWFWDTLVDADLANNASNWQWVAGTGADAAPFFRIFNPVLQGRRFDPEGGYVRRWVPELRRMPDRWLHAPWEAPGDVLRAADVGLGAGYPEPVVDHATARERALAAFRQIRA